MSTPSNRLSATMPATQPHTSSQAFAPPRIPPARKPAKSDSLPSPPSQGLGKHNKTERRYRRKVQAAQADLRDSVPALRVLYGSSTEEQLAMTDFRAPDGTVDGLGEINRPNASAKTTIFLGARMYIELLQSRVSTLQRKVNELEEFRMAVAGADDLARWQMDFDMRESEIQASMPVKHDSDELEDEEESEEEEPKRKRAKKASSAGNGRGFAAFALSLTLWPGASNLLGSKVSPKVIPGGESATSAAMITAEHVSRLLAMFIPMAFVPGADTLVSWTWKICLLAVLFVIIRAVIARQARNNVIIGNYASMAKDAAAVIVGVKSSVEDSLWTIKAAEMLGKGELSIVSEIMIDLDASLGPISIGPDPCRPPTQSVCTECILSDTTCPTSTLHPTIDLSRNPLETSASRFELQSPPGSSSGPLPSIGRGGAITRAPPTYRFANHRYRRASHPCPHQRYARQVVRPPGQSCHYAYRIIAQDSRCQRVR